MSDRIELRAMRFSGCHGVLPGEAEKAQRFEVDVVLEVDLAAAGASDDLAHTVDYGSIFAIARDVVEGPPMALVEVLAHRIATAVLVEHARVVAVTVRIRKMQPPLPGALAWAGVEIRRARPGT